MTAIRNFPNAPARPARRWQPPPWALKLWQVLRERAQHRAAAELERLAQRRARADPVFARQLHAAAATCRRDAASTQFTRSL